MDKSSYYVTTPIYYVNDKPHIGHAYTTVLADVLARYHRAKGDDTFFLTGTDEHGQKVQKAADANNMTPQQQCDETVVRFQELWKKLGITNDDFIRTTQERHKKIVRAIMQDLYDRDLIYKAEYKGRYCVPCERFFTEKDLAEGGLCPDCGRPTDEIIESNYFFRMSKYQDWLIQYITDHPDFIQPSFRANETLGFLRKPLEDLCISRPKSRLAWGIELPFDSDYVCYVWFDALINYISGIGYGSDEEKFNRFWKSCHHLIGKDILTTHTVYWPTMLKAIGVEMPQSIFAHGWWLVGTTKMSKSLGNVVNPMDMADKYGVDAFRYFLMAGMTLGNDASFTEEEFIARYNSDLANDLGNLLSRVVKLAIKNFDGKLPKPGEFQQLDLELGAKAHQAIDALAGAVNNMKLDKGLDTVMNVIRAGNRYLEQTAPWTLAKNGETERLGTVLYTAAEVLRVVSGLLMPLMPEKMSELRYTLGMTPEEINAFDFDSLRNIGVLTPGTELHDIAALFPRILVEDKAACAKAEPKKQEKKEKAKTVKPKQEEEPLPEGIITIDQFFKVQLKTAKVLTAEPVANTEKLMKMTIEVGEEVRPLVAGIAQFYKPEELIGKTIVVVANLRPAVIRGNESRGMLLAAKNENGLKLVTIDGGDFPSGVSIG